MSERVSENCNISQPDQEYGEASGKGIEGRAKALALGRKVRPGMARQIRSKGRNEKKKRSEGKREFKIKRIKRRLQQKGPHTHTCVRAGRQEYRSNPQNRSLPRSLARIYSLAGVYSGARKIGIGLEQAAALIKLEARL